MLCLGLLWALVLVLVVVVVVFRCGGVGGVCGCGDSSGSSHSELSVVHSARGATMSKWPVAMPQWLAMPQWPVAIALSVALALAAWRLWPEPTEELWDFDGVTWSCCGTPAVQGTSGWWYRDAAEWEAWNYDSSIIDPLVEHED